MEASMKRIALTLGFVCGVAFHGSVALAQGYMSLRPNGPAGTPVKAGDAASYMRAGTEWDQSPSTIIGGVATPTLLMPATITTWRDTALNFKFVIPFKTDKKPGGATLACGDQVIVQIAKNKNAATTLDTSGSDRYFRYEVVIKDSLVVGSKATKRVPRQAFGIWNWDTAEAATTATVSSLSAAGNEYAFTLSIPLSDIDNPGGDVGLALALINDLGHQTNGNGVHEASGTSFPLTMGVTPESDPGLTCGPVVTALAGGNWTKPNTWGTGYRDFASVPPGVTLSHSPDYVISNSIKLGNCDADQWTDVVALPSLANWEQHQQNSANGWYRYYPAKPCRMAVWVDAFVAAGGVVTKRFMVVWGRPGIAPQEWYFAGLTDPVPVSSPQTQLSFLWEKPPAVSFTSHPCLRVYVLKDNLAPADITAIKGIDSDAKLTAAVAAYVDAGLSQQSAQMNFSNIMTGACPAGVCSPIASLPQTGYRTAYAIGKGLPLASAAAGLAQPAGESGNRSPSEREPSGRARDEGVKEWKVRLMASGFGVAAPAPAKPYVYVEPVGGIGWFVSSTLFAKEALPLVFDVSNPRVTEMMFVGGHPVVVPGVPRRLLVALSAEAPSGMTPPAIASTGLKDYADRFFQPGETATAVIMVGGAARPGGDDVWWTRCRWVLFLALLLLLLVIWLLRRRPATA
jgi:hypothetical protein